MECLVLILTLIFLTVLISIYSHLNHIRKETKKIMSTVTELREVIEANASSFTTAFGGISDALTELSTDVSGLNDKIADLTEKVLNPELQDEIAALRDQGTATTERANAIAQAIRDAIPTAEPVVVETPAEEAPAEDAPAKGEGVE